MLNEEVERYRELSGDNNPHTPISRIGGYLDGYEKAMEQKTGHWKYIGNGHNGLFKCDNCGAHRNMFDELEKYCYACGAKMDVERWG